ncbi:MAG: GspH/FimT family pseudopilin [Verrucomicrobiota bacterium]
MKNSRRPIQRAAASGFTLLELLLVVVLVLTLAAALIFNFSTLLRGHQLEEGTTRLETLMRFARAQAANSGRKVQLVFNAESTNTPAATTGEVRATWEPDPLGQPGCFANLAEAQWHVHELNDLVQVESVKLLDASAACPASRSAEDEPEADEADSFSIRSMSPITFYPDGSSDSAEIIVSSRSVEEAQRMAVRLVGMTGAISHQLLAANWDESLEEVASVDSLGRTRRDGFRESVARDQRSENEPADAIPSPRSRANFSKLLPTAARATVGETNSVDQGE